MLAIVVVCALLTYGGVSLFVVLFAVYSFAAEAFGIGALPKRLFPPHRPGRVHFHHRQPARHPADPEHYPGRLLRDLMAVAGLTHRQSSRDISALTCIKPSAVFVVIAVYYLTGIVQPAIGQKRS